MPNAIIQHEESWLGWIVIEQVNYKFLLQLQITAFRLAISPERTCGLTLPKPLRKKYLDAFWENEGKIHDGGCVKELFFIKLRVGISQLHNRLTSLQTVFRDFK